MPPRRGLGELISLSEPDVSLNPSPISLTSAYNPLHIHQVHEILKRAPTSTQTTPPTAKLTHVVNTAPVNPNFDGGAGSHPASDFNNQAFLALFAALGAVFVLVAIWFFFWAKNGGFHFEEGDWEDYKSTVLRRKGPDGRTLTNATKSTKLGGSTIAGTQHYKWAKQQAKSVVSYDQKGRKGILGRRGWAKTHSITYSDDFTDWGDGKTSYTDMKEARHLSSPDASPQRPAGYRDRDVQDYKREKPAKVGGLNRVADGSHISSGFSTTEGGSELYSDSDSRPIMSKKERSEADKDRAERRARAEAAKMERRWKREAEEAAAAIARESARSPIPEPAKSTPPPPKHRQRSESRSASPRKRDTRDFSYQAGPESELLSTSGTSPSKRTSSSYYEEYRPRATENARYSSAGQQQRQSSPTKKLSTAPRSSGYRRGADSDLD